MSQRPKQDKIWDGKKKIGLGACSEVHSIQMVVVYHSRITTDFDMLQHAKHQRNFCCCRYLKNQNLIPMIKSFSKNIVHINKKLLKMLCFYSKKNLLFALMRYKKISKKRPCKPFEAQTEV